MGNHLVGIVFQVLSRHEVGDNSLIRQDEVHGQFFSRTYVHRLGNTAVQEGTQRNGITAFGNLLSGPTTLGVGNTRKDFFARTVVLDRDDGPRESAEALT